MLAADVKMRRIEDAIYESAYEVLLNGQRVGLVRRRADGLWTATSVTGWSGQDDTRGVLVDRMVRYGVER